MLISSIRQNLNNGKNVIITNNKEINENNKDLFRAIHYHIKVIELKRFF